MARRTTSDQYLHYVDLVLLWVIMEYTNTYKTPPKQTMLYSKDGPSLIDKWLDENEIDPIYTSGISGSNALSQSIDRLRKTNLILPASPYRPTGKGQLLVRDYLDEDPTKWAIKLPFDTDGQLLFSNAVYANISN